MKRVKLQDDKLLERAVKQLDECIAKAKELVGASKQLSDLARKVLVATRKDQL